MSKFPASFLEAMQTQLGREYSDFLAAMQQIPPISIRLNPRKPTNRFPEALPVLWCADGRYLPQRPIFTADPLFHAGAYYVQEASSMYLAAIIAHLKLDTKPIRCLDLCAAPGGKSTLLADVLHNDSFLLANEVVKLRAHILAENLVKWGLPNTFAACNGVNDMQALKGFFDLILIDAPCSGEGMFRKDHDAIAEWSPRHVKFCAARQKRILADTLPLLADEGVLIYSTCTFNAEENEAQAEWLCNEMGLRPLSLPNAAEWGIVNGHFYPHRLLGEGFFVQCFKNQGAAINKEKKTHSPKNIRNEKPSKNARTYNEIPQKKLPDMAQWLARPNDFVFIEENGACFALPLSQQEAWAKVKSAALYLNKQGIHIGKWAKNELIPAHDLALSIDIAPTIADCPLDLADALTYLRCQTPPLAAEKLGVQGRQTVSFEGLRLGWIKIFDGRLNNYYPKEWRIRHL